MFTSHQSGAGGDHVGREEGGLVLDLRTMTKLLFKCFTVSFCVVLAFCLQILCLFAVYDRLLPAICDV